MKKKSANSNILNASLVMRFPAVTSADSVKMCCDTSNVSVNSDSSASEEERIPTFWANAYNGGPVEVEGWDYPIVVDLAGMKFVRQDLPVRLEHNANRGVGHTTQIVVENADTRPWLSISGVISRKTTYANDVIESSKRGFPWSVSIGAIILSTKKIAKGESVEVNGQVHVGPLFVGQQSLLRELSFVDLGADYSARGYVAAGDFGSFFGGTVMKRKKGQVDAGNEPNDDSSDDQVIEAQADDGDGGASDDVTLEPKPKVKGKKVVTAASTPSDASLSADDIVTEHRKKVAAEIERTNTIAKLCGDKHGEVQAKAIAEGWSPERCELEIQREELKSLRASRATGVAIHVNGGEGITGDVIEAAIAISGQLDGLEKHYPEKVLDAADKKFKHRIGLQEALLEAAAANGTRAMTFQSNPRGILEAAFSGRSMQASAGLSTINIGGILSNVANKFLLQGFMGVEQVWRQIAAIASVRDFKQVTSYRLTGSEMYKKISPGGEIRHGDLGEETFTNQAETYGLMLSVSRTNIINDDLGAITSVPKKLGRGAGLKINDVFWAEFLDDASFFSVGNENLLSDALDIDGVGAAEQAFFEMEDPEGNPLGVVPKILLVPPALNSVAKEIYNSTEIWPATGSGDKPMGNPHKGSYAPIMSAYLKAEDADWYLLAAPSDLPVIEVCFLNGQQSPTIETAEANFNTLGIQFRGYHDFGVRKQDYRGGVKSAP